MAARPLETDVPFEGVFGDTSQLRIAEKLLAMRSFQLNQKEIAERVGITRQSAAKALETFHKWGLVTREEKGNQVLYQLDESSVLGYAIDALNGALLEIITGKELVERTPTLDLSKWSKDFVNVLPDTKARGTLVRATAA